MKKVLSCEKGHEFGEKAKFKTCPFCKTPLTTVYKGYDEKIKNYFLKRTTKTEIHDSLPRVPWFGDMLNMESEILNSKKEWKLDEVLKLSEKFKEYGIGDEKLWKEIAEKAFGRSLCAVEHILRFVVAADMDMLNLNEIFG